jgi:hypothetical protein
MIMKIGDNVKVIGGTYCGRSGIISHWPKNPMRLNVYVTLFDEKPTMTVCIRTNNVLVVTNTMDEDDEGDDSTIVEEVEKEIEKLVFELEKVSIKLNNMKFKNLKKRKTKGRL